MAAHKRGNRPSVNAQVDVESPKFKADLEALTEEEFEAALATLEQVTEMTWDVIYRHKGLNWEEIASVKPPKSLGIEKWFSIRFTKKRQMRVFREGNYMRCIDIPPDHDSTYSLP